jgi:hypothetical protein
MRKALLLLGYCLFLPLLTGIADAAVIVDVEASLNNILNPVIVPLDAGTYTVTPIGTAEGGAFNAWSPWPGTSCANPGGCPATTPTTSTGWLTTYDVISLALTLVTIEGATPAEVSTPQPYIEDYFLVTPTARRYHVGQSNVYPSTAIALFFARPSEFTLNAASDVGFAISDTMLADNRGGISLLVAPTDIPEPAALLLGMLGVAALVRTRETARARRG